MKQTEKIDKLIKNLKTTATPDLDRRIDALIETAPSPSMRPLSIWRYLMKQRKLQLAVSLFIVVFVLGLVPVQGRTGFGRLSTMLERLQAMVRGQDPAAGQAPAAPVDSSIKIRTQSWYYIGPDSQPILSFLDEKNISRNTNETGGIFYAALSLDDICALKSWLKANPGFSLTAAPTVVTFAGQEAMIASIDTEGGRIVGIGLIVHTGQANSLLLDFAFQNSQDGFELNAVPLTPPAGLLVSGIPAGDQVATVLVVPEVTSK
jgi:hypothetical protein